VRRPLLGPFGLILLSSCIAAQPAAVPIMGGYWRLENGAVVVITQKGNQVISKYVHVKGRGYKPGDLDFSGTISGHKLSVAANLHYPIRFKTLCPSQWAQSTHEDISLSSSGDKMVAKWKGSLIHDDCSETDGSWHVTKYTEIVFEVDEPPVEPVDRKKLAKVPPRPTPVSQRAERISLVPGQDSAVVGSPIHLDVWISGASARRVVADRDYVINLTSDAGSVDPSQVTILKGGADASTFLTSDHPGKVEVHASTDGLPPAIRSTTFCDSDAVSDFELVKTTEQAPADGKKTIPLQVKFMDLKGAPTTGNQRKGLGFDPRGVGMWRPALNQMGRISPGFDVPDDQCIGPIEAVSTVPGRTTATVIFQNHSKSRDFLFTVTWTWVLFSIIGALIGVFARLASKFRKGQTLRYFVSEALIGLIAGIAVMLAAYAGMAHYAVPANGEVLGILMPSLLGLVGGYLGKRALDGISKMTTRNRATASSADRL